MEIYELLTSLLDKNVLSDEAKKKVEEFLKNDDCLIELKSENGANSVRIQGSKTNYVPLITASIIEMGKTNVITKSDLLFIIKELIAFEEKMK